MGQAWQDRQTDGTGQGRQAGKQTGQADRIGRPDIQTGQTGQTDTCRRLALEVVAVLQLPHEVRRGEDGRDAQLGRLYTKGHPAEPSANCECEQPQIWRPLRCRRRRGRRCGLRRAYDGGVDLCDRNAQRFRCGGAICKLGVQPVRDARRRCRAGADSGGHAHARGAQDERDRAGVHSRHPCQRLRERARAEIVHLASNNHRDAHSSPRRTGRQRWRATRW